jgi:hypothetical protein
VDVYHIWFDLKPGVSDVGLCANVDAYLGKLRDAGKIVAFRIGRRKLGLGPSDVGEFHVAVEVRDLAQLDTAFRVVSERAEPVEGLHAAVNQSVTNLRFALYRDFPDPHRTRGQERF